MHWRYDWLLDLPAEVYRVLIEMVEDGTLTGHAPEE